jgi:SAM-dependent methyltransferase
MHCPLCLSQSFEAIDVTARPAATFWHCLDCSLIYRDPGQRLNLSQEKARYEEHINGGDGHRNFLRPISAILSNLPLSGRRGLDWGSGPEPVLVEILRKNQFEMTAYDPIFGPELPPPDKFDFITLTEVIEHFFEPSRDLKQILSYLKPGGYLLVMTDPVPELWWDLSFAERATWLGAWAYRRDPSHVSFFSERTFRKMEGLFGLKLHSLKGRIVTFQLPA